MKSLSDIRAVEYNIINGKAKTVKALYTIVFGDEGQTRLNRNKLKQFTGFDFNDDSDEFTTKLEEVNRNLSYPDLVSVCHVLDIDYEGTKEEVASRIVSYLCHLDEARDNEGNKDDEDDNEEEQDEEKQDEQIDQDEDELTRRPVSRASYESRRTTNKEVSSVDDTKSFSLSFRDVEDSIRKYDGKDGYPVIKWIQDFEEMATIMKWNDLQKLIFAKKSLDGLAKVLVQSEKGITTWSKLKSILKKEFEVKIDSAQIHKTLMTRRKQKEETVQEYVLIMREIGSRANIEHESIIQYIIDGIPDDTNNKIILYGAKNFEEFKEKTRLYTAWKNKTTVEMKTNRGDFTRKENTKFKTENGADTKHTKYDIRCFGCGIKGHQSRECPSREKGKKCFKCNNFGHIATNCPVKKEEKESKTVNKIMVTPKNHISLEVYDHKIAALVDSGADVSILREDTYKTLGSPELNQKTLNLSGIGTNTVETKGSFMVTGQIDKEEYDIQFHVVPCEALQMEAIIGTDLLHQADIEISSNGVKIIKKKEENMLMQISCENKSPHAIDLSHLCEKTRESVENIVRSYQPNKTEDTDVEMKIIMKDEIPIFQPARRLPFSERKEVEEQIQQWLEDGIIKHSCSEFASPVVVVRKKDNTARVCIDYRRINKAIIKDRYPLPLIEDQLDQLQNAKIFTTIDLKNGFFHVKVAEDSRKYTAFITHQGQYEFTKVPFGLCNSPAVFQRYINSVLRKLIQKKIVLVYVDDVIIPAIDEKEAIERLKLFFEVAQKHGLEVNWKKCQILKKRISFLGYVIEDQMIRPSEEKIAAVKRFPRPTTVRQVQSFLGLTGYFRKFIPRYAIIAKPLTDLLRNEAKFIFKEEQEKAFQELQEKLITKPVLHIYQRGRRLELHTDASKHGFGAVLLQECPEDRKLHPIHYMSRKTTPTQENYCSYELEVLAIIEALTKFRVYLLGNDFKLVTDCQAFQKTMEKRSLAPRVARWALLLEDFNYTIEHRSGNRLPHVDALSRHPVYAINVDGILPKLKVAQNKDEHTRVIRKILETQPYEDYQLKNDLLYKYENPNELLVVPTNMQNEIIRLAHEIGHFGVKKTEELIKRDYFIPKVKDKIARIISNCVPCILANRKQGKREGFLHPLPKEDKPLTTFHIDHLGPLPTTNKRYNHILAVIDDFTKFVWIFPTKSTTTRETIDCLQKIQTNFGNPEKIITDRGTSFTSEEFKIYCREQNIKHFLITTGVPRGNGQIERIHRTIIPVLAKLSIDNPATWYKHIQRVQRTMNSTFQRSIQMTPFELLTGVKMKTKEDIGIQKFIEEEFITEFQEDREELRRKGKEHLLKIQEENRRTYNLRRKKATQYRVGDLVAIKRTQFGVGLKVAKKFFGPYEITKVKPKERYDVKKVGDHDGPNSTNTCAEYLKPWCGEGEDFEESETDSMQNGRDVGF